MNPLGSYRALECDALVIPGITWYEKNTYKLSHTVCLYVYSLTIPSDVSDVGSRTALNTVVIRHVIS